MVQRLEVPVASNVLFGALGSEDAVGFALLEPGDGETFEYLGVLGLVQRARGEEDRVACLESQSPAEQNLNTNGPPSR